jgi:chaperonin GroES
MAPPGASARVIATNRSVGRRSACSRGGTVRTGDGRLINMPQDLTTAGKLPIKMLHDRILVALRKEDGDRRSSGGILIPATAQVAKRLVWGEARGVGASCRQVKVGDQVLFSPEDQHEVEVHGEDLIILRERDVHAVAAERIEESTGLYL